MLSNIKKQYTLIGHLAFLLLFVIAFVFYKERTLNFDSAFYAIRLLATGDFYVAHGRGVNYLWQWLPLLVFKFGGSLKAFMYSMSLSPLLLLYGIFLIITHYFRNPKAGVYLALALVLTTRYKFYAAISEIYLSIGLVALIVAFLSMEKDRFDWAAHKKLLLFLFLISLTYLGHPFLIFPVLFIMGADVIWNNRWKDKTVWLGIAAALILFFTRYALIKFSSASYESAKMNSVGLGTFKKVLLHPFETYSVRILGSFADSQWFFAIAFFLLATYLLFRKNKLLALYLLAFTGFWFVFVAAVCSYLSGDIYAMIEGYCGFFALVWALPLIYLNFEDVKWQKLLPIAASFLLLFSIHRIYTKSSFFTDRLAKLENIISLNPPDGEASRNIMLKMDGKYWRELWYPWPVPYETLILSSLKDPTKTSIVYIADDPKKVEKYTKYDLRYMPPFNDDTYALPKHYFNIDKRPFTLTGNAGF